MQDEIVRRNTILLLVSFIAFFVLSVLIFSYSNKQSIEKVLINESNVIVNSFKETKTEDEISVVGTLYTKDQTWLEIQCSNSNGYIIYDSTDDTTSGISKSRIDIKYILKSIDSYNNSQSGYVYTLDDRLYCITCVNDDLYIVISVETTDSSTYTLIALLVISIILVFVIMLSVFLTKKTTDKIINSFKFVRNNLENINNNNFVKEENTISYPEVTEVMNQINDINDKIYQSMLHIRHEHDKLDFIIDNMDQGIIIIDKEENILLINKYALQAVERNKIVKSFTDIKYYELLINNTFNEKIKYSLDNEFNQFFDLHLDNGKIYLCDLSISAHSWDLSKPKDKILFILLKDVTTDRLNDMKKSEFISNAAHELKSPVTSIKGFAELLNDNINEYDDLTKKSLSVIYNQSVRMQDTITELLYLSSLEGKVISDSDLEYINLHDIVEEVFQTNSFRAKTKNIHLINNINPNIEIKTKPDLFIHLMSNLVDNGIKYNKHIDGNGMVSVEIEELDNLFNIKVSDNGDGIDEKSINHIFERFYRVDESHNSKTGGTGLGLHIVSEICKVINAKITVNSKIGKGTMFTISINK